MIATAPLPSLASTLAQTFIETFTGLIEGLRAAVFTRGNGGGNFGDGSSLALYVPLLMQRFTRLITRFRTIATTPYPFVLPYRFRPAYNMSKEEFRARYSERKPDCVKFPRGFAWLVNLVPEAGGIADEFCAFLADPAISYILEEDPRYGDALRPLCHALGLKVPECLAKVVLIDPFEKPRRPDSTGKPMPSNIPFDAQIPPERRYPLFLQQLARIRATRAAAARSPP
ncbi:MAG TPA: hypothetical protein VF286_10510 [Acidiphilium sp.]